MSSKFEVRSSLLRESQLIPHSGHVPIKRLDANGNPLPEPRHSGETNAISTNTGTGMMNEENPEAIPLVYLPRVGLGLGVAGEATSGNLPYSPSILSSTDDEEGGGGNPFSVTTSTAAGETDKLWSVLANYLSLGQLELARTVMDQLFMACPEKLIRALRDMIFAKIPSAWSVKGNTTKWKRRGGTCLVSCSLLLNVCYYFLFLPFILSPPGFSLEPFLQPVISPGWPTSNIKSYTLASIRMPHRLPNWRVKMSCYARTCWRVRNESAGLEEQADITRHHSRWDRRHQRNR